MRLGKNSVSRVQLSDILRRRRKSLTSFLSEFGIVSYELLLERCRNMGVTPPDEQTFLAATGGIPPRLSSPTEGVVVVEVTPSNIIEESSGKLMAQTPVEVTELVQENSEKSVGKNTKRKKEKFVQSS